MTEILELDNLAANSPNFDIEPYLLEPDVFSYAKNYLIRDNRYRSFNGEKVITSNNATNVAYVDFIQKSETEYYFLLGGRASVYIYSTLGFASIGHVSGYPNTVGFEDTWEGCKLGYLPIITSIEHFPEYWTTTPITQTMQDLPFSATQTWRQKGYTCRIMRSHLNFLFALGLKEGSTEYPNAYRWSHPADTGSLPFSWDELDTSTIASKEFLDDEYIIDGCSLRNEFAIYTNRGIHILTFRGDSDTPFVRRKLSTTQNLITSKCVVEVLGANYFLSNNDIMLNDGTNIRSLLDKRFKTFLRDSLSQDNFKNCYAVVNGNTKEVWFYIVQKTFTYPNIAIVINYVDNNVSMRSVNGAKPHACYGLIESVPTSALTWDAENVETWNSNSQPWYDTLSSPFEFGVINVSTNGGLDSPDRLENFAITGSYDTVLERTYVQLDDTQTVTTIVRVTPKIKSNGTVLIEIGSHNHYNSPVRWKSGIIFNPNVQRKVDIRTTGELHAWRISSVGSTYFEFYGFEVVYEKAGERIGGFVPAVQR